MCRSARSDRALTRTVSAGAAVPDRRADGAVDEEQALFVGCNHRSVLSVASPAYLDDGGAAHDEADLQRKGRSQQSDEAQERPIGRGEDASGNGNTDHERGDGQQDHVQPSPQGRGRRHRLVNLFHDMTAREHEDGGSCRNGCGRRSSRSPVDNAVEARHQEADADQGDDKHGLARPAQSPGLRSQRFPNLQGGVPIEQYVPYFVGRAVPVRERYRQDEVLRVGRPRVPA